MLKALVTGASGFIGSHLVAKLNELGGYEVHCLMRKTSKPRNLEGLTYQVREGELRDAASLARAVAGIDVVFHLAGVVAAPTREEFFEPNAAGTGRLAEAAAHAGVKKFVYVSSLAAGGPALAFRPRVESDPDAPVSLYGESKLAGERELLKFRDTLPTVIIRPPFVYGPKDRNALVLFSIVGKRLMPVITGGGEGGHRHYSFVHSSDLVDAIVAASRANVASGEIYYVGEDRHYTYTEFLRGIQSALGTRALKFPVPEAVVVALGHSFQWLGDRAGRSFALNRDKLAEILANYWICSNEKAKRDLGFVPQVALAKGLPETVQWYRAKGWL